MMRRIRREVLNNGSVVVGRETRYRGILGIKSRGPVSRQFPYWLEPIRYSWRAFIRAGIVIGDGVLDDGIAIGTFFSRWWSVWAARSESADRTQAHLPIPFPTIIILSCTKTLV